MTNTDLSETVINEIKSHILFFISDERLYSSTLYEVMKLSPGHWFDVEELALRKSVKMLCNDIEKIRDIIKTLDEFEYNELTSQIRIKYALLVIEDIVNDRTVIFYCSKAEFDEETLFNICKENNLTILIVRFLKFCQLRRRDLKPIYPILKNKVNESTTDIIILKMFHRIEAFKIKKIINQQYPNTESCLAITNYFPNGCLSINQPVDNKIPTNSESTKPEFLSVQEAMTDSTIMISRYIYRSNEYAVILDHLIENNTKPLIYRNFVECRLKSSDMGKLLKHLFIPPSFIGCFSLMTFNTIVESTKAIALIKEILPYLELKTISECKNMDNVPRRRKPYGYSSYMSDKGSVYSDNLERNKSWCKNLASTSWDATYMDVDETILNGFICPDDKFQECDEYETGNTVEDLSQNTDEYNSNNTVYNGLQTSVDLLTINAPDDPQLDSPLNESGQNENELHIQYSEKNISKKAYRISQCYDSRGVHSTFPNRVVSNNYKMTGQKVRVSRKSNKDNPKKLTENVQ